eukprot:5878504-Pleurochrysis_carterae.AAC.2
MAATTTAISSATPASACCAGATAMPPYYTALSKSKAFETGSKSGTISRHCPTSRMFVPPLIPDCSPQSAL